MPPTAQIVPFGTRVKILRLFYGLTQKDLSEMIKLSNNRLCSIEQNSLYPTEDVIKRIAEAFNVTSSYLLLPRFSVPPRATSKQGYQHP
jgi:transcriptional regulator with XRE-family HTH domain